MHTSCMPARFEKLEKEVFIIDDLLVSNIKVNAKWLHMVGQVGIKYPANRKSQSSLIFNGFKEG